MSVGKEIRLTSMTYILRKLELQMMVLLIYKDITDQASQVALMVKNLPANAGDVRDLGLILGLQRSSGGGNGTPL